MAQIQPRINDRQLVSVAEARELIAAHKSRTRQGRGVAERVPRRTCELCGGQFYAPPSQVRRGGGKFCSVKCRAVAIGAGIRERRVILKCATCGKEQLVAASVAEKRVHCSLICAKQSPKATGTCPRCGSAFRLKPLTRKYCSRACAVKSRAAAAPKPMVICEACGRWFPRLGGTRGRFCSTTCWGRVLAQANRHGNVYSRTRGGKRPDLDDVYFRSAWEANWARYLNYLKDHGVITAWAYEPETFEFLGIKRGTRFYTPDFRVTNMDGSVEYHEIKGWMDKKSQTKLRRMRQRYPAIKVVLIDKAAYSEVARKIGRALAGWEWNAKHAN